LKLIRFYQLVVKWNRPRVYYGAVVGHTTTTKVKIWIRNKHEGKYHFILSSSKLTATELNINSNSASDFIESIGAKLVYNKAEQFSNKTDRTCVFSASELNPDSRYFYYLFSDDAKIRVV